MAGTVTITEPSPKPPSLEFPIRKRRIAWTSDASGDATGSIGFFSGTIERVVFTPDGTDAPTDDYDVTITDEDGFDVLSGQGADRDTANAEQVIPGVAFTDGVTAGVWPVVVHGELSLAVAAAGNAKSGTIDLYLR